MADPAARDIANLKLQLDALQKSAEAASLPDAVTKMRATVKWSAVVIAVALVASSLIRMFSDSDVRDLRHRIEKLESGRTEKPLPTP